MPTLEELEKLIEEMKLMEFNKQMSKAKYHGGETNMKVEVFTPQLKKIRKGTQKGG